MPSPPPPPPLLVSVLAAANFQNKGSLDWGLPRRPSWEDRDQTVSPVSNKAHLFKMPLAVSVWSFFAFGTLGPLGRKAAGRQNIFSLTELVMSLFTSPSSIYLGIITSIYLDIKLWEDVGMHISPYSAEEI